MSYPYNTRVNVVDLSTLRVLPKHQLPTSLGQPTFSLQCIEAAQASRLDPYALHQGEQKLLGSVLTTKDNLTLYLNVRNAILRLWLRKPETALTSDEARGCLPEGADEGYADAAFKWLVREGYINHGCLDVGQSSHFTGPPTKTVVVIGAGIAGLAAARHLDGLFAQESLINPPRVIVLEGRHVIGGRTCSTKLRNQSGPTEFPTFLPKAADLGAMIIPGFCGGNPLEPIIRGQLGMCYRPVSEQMEVYDYDGTRILPAKERLVTDLYTDISHRLAKFRAKKLQTSTMTGFKMRVDNAHVPPRQSEREKEMLIPFVNHECRMGVVKPGRRENAPSGRGRPVREERMVREADTRATPAVRAARSMGWKARKQGQEGADDETIAVQDKGNVEETLNDALKQYQRLIFLGTEEIRLLNWHNANLEATHGVPLAGLSMTAHDQNAGTEFEGPHAIIAGGIGQLPHALSVYPTQLNIRFGSVVEGIEYDGEEGPKQGIAKVKCVNGEIFEADAVINTIPLGVLKQNSVIFNPPLPKWKQDAMGRLGWGLLNQLILVYDKPFWNEEQEVFGLLNDSEPSESDDSSAYARSRGRFFKILNVTKTSGRPTLVAFMAGYAAFEVEETPMYILLAELHERLGRIFQTEKLPEPKEVIMTRWGKDRFTKGAFTYTTTDTWSGDYQLMAKPIGNMYFAGEATNSAYPGTVHGAYLSGLRAASEVAERLIGPINITRDFAIPTSQKKKPEKDITNPELEAAVEATVIERLGPRPKWKRSSEINPFLAWYHQRKAELSSANANANVRMETLGPEWKALSDEERRPFMSAAKIAQKRNKEAKIAYDAQLRNWQRGKQKIREELLRGQGV
ncbi:hypothetical protein K470DRAFT_221478 [Piedraia hortae CBS 480.64]|uniref:SWIRM domain-containing protein n=1 Tax=Piedraia hortae CBS 480.64 TaxID=1314780 RepID=A0A6A7BV02_9PEZI|nr:hypothetical protein K470DRAFT_221478 [Piedraia hortae CBS 480.64]